MLFLPKALTPTARLFRHFVRTSNLSEETSETVSSFIPRDAPPQNKKSNSFSHPETGNLLGNDRLLAPSLRARKPQRGRCAFSCCNP